MITTKLKELLFGKLPEDGKKARNIKNEIKRQSTMTTNKMKELNVLLEQRSFFIAQAIGYDLNGKKK